MLGGIYLIARRVISPAIPCVYLGTAAVLSFVMGRDPLFDLLSGGLMLGAVFMATDYTTSPIHLKGRIVYAIGCGVLTMLIRQFRFAGRRRFLFDRHHEYSGSAD